MRRRGSTQAAAAAAGVGGGHGSKDGDDAATRKRRYLNGRITKLHNVRAEPIREAKVVGYLTATKEARTLSLGRGLGLICAASCSYSVLLYTGCD